MCYANIPLGGHARATSPGRARQRGGGCSHWRTGAYDFPPLPKERFLDLMARRKLLKPREAPSRLGG
jgi:hypothetical protein